MKHALPLFASLALMALAACGGKQTLYPVPMSSPTERVSIAYGAVQLRNVGLPSYAEDQDIYVQGADGGLKPLKGVAWADRPARGVTQDLALALAQTTGARVAAEPWPFQSYPDVELDVRFTTLAVGMDGRFVMEGQYFVAGQERGTRERARNFALRVALPEKFGPAQIAQARGEATAQLARQIARDGLK